MHPYHPTFHQQTESDIHMHSYACMHMYIYGSVCMHVCVYMYRYNICMYGHIIYIYICVCVCMGVYMCIKTSDSESRGQEEAACTRVLGLCDHYSELFTRMEALNFKMLWLSGYYSYRLVYYRPSTSYRVEPTYEGSVKLAQPFLKNQPVREFWCSFP